MDKETLESLNIDPTDPTVSSHLVNLPPIELDDGSAKKGDVAQVSPAAVRPPEPIDEVKHKYSVVYRTEYGDILAYYHSYVIHQNSAGNKYLVLSIDRRGPVVPEFVPKPGHKVKLLLTDVDTGGKSVTEKCEVIPLGLHFPFEKYHTLDVLLIVGDDDGKTSGD